MSADLVYLIPLLPLLGFLLSGALGKRLGKGFVTVVSVGVMVAAFLLSVGLFVSYQPSEHPTVVVAYDWISANPGSTEGLSIAAAFLIDPLSLVMLLVVTGVGTLIHIYSIGYMQADESFHRFFAYLNLFVFFMLILVLAESMALMFVGWEGVGLCSYLLIGFWYEKPSAADAGLKAFLVNRIGDFGFVVAMVTAFSVFGTLSFTAIVAGTPAAIVAYGTGPLVLIGFALFLAATGKSAQLPLYVWLPDAMEGPSPVSALIHAATMVTSGVYMIARLFGMFALIPHVLEVVAIVGAVTAAFAASMGLTATDIKKVLAYSTVSQLGYMFLGLGVGAVSAGMFHLVTHAFFKACLFLGAGAVMHALHDETDLRKMGGLRKKLPITWLTMLAATLAIVGTPVFAGFVSKDAILLAAYQAHAWPAFGLGLFTVGLTSFYMFRLYFMTFHGEPRDQELYDNAHDATPTMAVALIPLAILSLVAGVLNWPKGLFGGERFSEFIASSVHVPGAVDAHHGHLSTAQEIMFSSAIALPAVLGLLLAYSWYCGASEAPARFAARFGGAYRLLSRKWYVDEIYGFVVVGGVKRFSRFLRSWVDEIFIDGTVNLVALGTQVVGEVTRAFQTGLLRNYALFLVLGATAVLVMVVF